MAYYSCCRPKLALEYQGKATKLRQQVFGDQHDITTKSLDFFTVIYAEVGKQQYTGMPTCDIMNTSVHINTFILK